MNVLILILFCMSIVGVATNHAGAGILAFVSMVFFIWVTDIMNRNELSHSITDEDIDPRIKS